MKAKVKIIGELEFEPSDYDCKAGDDAKASVISTLTADLQDETPNLAPGAEITIEIDEEELNKALSEGVEEEEEEGDDDEPDDTERDAQETKNA